MNRGGFTLVELIVVLAIMGILAGVAAFAAGGAISAPSTGGNAEVAERDSVARDGRPRSLRRTDSLGTVRWTTWLPDGRLVSGSVLGK